MILLSIERQRPLSFEVSICAQRENSIFLHPFCETMTLRLLVHSSSFHEVTEETSVHRGICQDNHSNTSGSSCEC